MGDDVKFVVGLVAGYAVAHMKSFDGVAQKLADKLRAWARPDEENS